MTLERFFQKKTELKQANTWIAAMKAREVQKNSFHATGDLKKTHEFAHALEQQLKHPAPYVEVQEERVVEPITIFSKNSLDTVRPALVA